MAGAVEGDGSARAAHAADEILALAINETDDGVLVGGEAGGAAPLVGDLDRASAEVAVHLADEEFGDKARGLIVASEVVGQLRGVGADHHATAVAAEKAALATQTDVFPHAGGTALAESGLGLHGVQHAAKLAV